MDFTRFFGTIYEPYFTILTNFYFYLFIVLLAINF